MAIIGSVNNAAFTSVNWAGGNRYLEVEVDDGSGFASMGRTQMMSVPYALYAKSSGGGLQGAPGISIDWLGSLTTPPTSPSLNQAYYNSINKKSYVYDG